MYKSGYVYFIGRPNVGKSSIINKLMGEKLAIVSDKPQATRNNIRFIDTGEDYQLIYVDTPGIQTPKNKLGDYLLKQSQKAFKDADLICYVVEPETKIGKQDSLIMDLIRNKANLPPIVLVINQIDKTEDYLEVVEFFNNLNLFDEVVAVSAMEDRGLVELKEVIKKIIPKGPMYYPDDLIVDKTEKFMVSEIIREKALEFLNDELPHGIVIEIESYKEGSPIMIEAIIYCERNSHKGMVIGKNGQMIKLIGTEARKEIEGFLGKKVVLKLRVKVALDWRKKAKIISSLGYIDD